MVNQKGGVGKTASTKGLAGALTEQGRRVLLVDWDPQGHLTEALGAPETTPPATVAERILGHWSGPVGELVWRHETGIDVLATNVDAFLLAAQLYPTRAKEFRLAALLDELDAYDEYEGSYPYDDVLIDCPPELGVLTDNALWAVRRTGSARRSGVVVPALAEDSTLRALRLLLAQIDSLQAQLAVTVDVLGLVINAYDRRRGGIVTSTMHALTALPGLEHLATVDDLKHVREAWRAQTPVVQHAPESPSAASYRELVRALDGQGAHE